MHGDKGGDIVEFGEDTCHYRLVGLMNEKLRLPMLDPTLHNVLVNAR